MRLAALVMLSLFVCACPAPQRAFDGSTPDDASVPDAGAPLCAAACGEHEVCDGISLKCVCALGYQGEHCSVCSAGFVSDGGVCALPVDLDTTTWPNAVSRTNGDAWLRAHHDSVSRLEPKVLVLNFVNPSDPSRMAAKVDGLIAAFAEASRWQPLTHPGSQVQLQYQLAKPVIDLRDGVNGRPPAPAGWQWQNSTLYPRRMPGSPGYWRFDYAALFTQAFAPNYGYPDVDRPGQFLDLCTLVERGEINEVWFIASGDVAGDANAAEVLVAMPKYTVTGNRIPGDPDRCAGNGCLDPDVPACARSVRLGFINYNRGLGCYLHSQGHFLERFANSDDAPALRAWFQPYAGFALDERYGLPADSFYGVSCTGSPCIAYPSETSISVTHQGATKTVSGWDGVCGNVHFPPNGAKHYDYDSDVRVMSSCEDFGGHHGERGADAPWHVNRTTWAGNTAIASDCGGEFLVWWYQNMPGFQTGQRFANGTPMRSVWPFWFY